MIKKYLSFTTLMFLSGCISVTSLPAQNAHKISKICIQHNPKVIVPGFTETLQEAFLRHGITSTLTDDIAPTCPYHLTYVAYQRWDFVMFMSTAHIDLYKGEMIIGYSDRHMPFGSGLDFSKWDSTETKVDEMVNQLLAETAPLQ